MAFYPLFIKSNAYIYAEKSKPILPNKPSEPIKPKLIKKNWFENIFLQHEENEDVLINMKRIEVYLSKLQIYHDEVVVYQDKIREILSETNISLFRKTKKQEILKETKQAVISLRETLKGSSEFVFYQFLKNKFSEKIYNNLELELPNNNSFVPDFAYIDIKVGLCIDIEIDEPYALDSKNPIHYLGKDDSRNNYFQEKGWFILRFAEEQIVTQPNECVVYIQKIIEHITENKELLDVDSIKKIKQWSYNDSLSMANVDYRKSYY